MEDAKVKREARRRKILENSEKRLQKITRFKTDEESENSTETSNKIPKRTTYKEPNEGTKLIREPVITKSSTNDVLHQNDVHQQEPVQTDFSFREPTNNSFAGRSTKTTSKLSRKLWTTLGFKLVLLAVVVRIVHVFKLGYLFGETIVIPFSLYMMTQLGSFQFDQNIAAGLAGPILFFIGMPPNKIKNLLICYNVVTSILLYFAIYFFSFICAHLIFVKNQAEALSRCCTKIGAQICCVWMDYPLQA